MTALFLVQRRGTVEIVYGVVDCFHRLSGALWNGSSKWRIHSHTKSMRTWFTCTGTVMAVQMQLWTSIGEDIRCAEHQTGLFLPTFRALRECGTLPSVHVSSERGSIQKVEEQEEIVSIQRSPTTSTRRIASRIRVPQSRVWRKLHYDGLYPFHHQPVQHLHPGDDAQQLQFCYWLSHYRELLPYILFTDEATFTRNGINNTRNSHNWAQDNPHGTIVTNFQTRFSVNVWCGIINDMLIGPVIIEHRMTGDSYLHFLQNYLPEQLENVSLDTRRHMYLQHDEAPIHYTKKVIQRLNNTYPNRWIG